MAVLIDTPRWPAHGRLWAHLVSDTSLVELHAFAAAAGVPRRSFEGDHYDVPAERHGRIVAAGATLVDGRVLVKALQRSGLRLPKRKGERVLLTVEGVDVVASSLAPLGAAIGPDLLLAPDDERRLAVHDGALPPARGGDPRCGYLRLRAGGSAATWQHLALRSGRRDDLPHVDAAALGAHASLLAALVDHLGTTSPVSERADPPG